MRFEPPRDKTNKVACAPSEDFGQPGHLPSLIRVFPVRMKKAWILSYPLSAQQRLWSDWVDAQADLRLRWAYMPFCWFCHEVAHLVTVILNLQNYIDEEIQKSFGNVWALASVSKGDALIIMHNLWATAWQNQQNGLHLPSLISVFAVCSVGCYGPKVSSCGQRRLRSDLAGAQADLSLRWAQSFCWLCHSAALT